MLARPLAARRIHTTDEDSNENQFSSDDDDVGLSDDSDSSSSEDQETPMRPPLSVPKLRSSHEDAGGEDSDDEPPEIPGSPMAQVASWLISHPLTSIHLS